MTALWITLGALAALNIARKAVDRAARWRHWRVGRWGRILCIWKRVGEECLHCHTDYRYVLAHPIRYAGDTKETARAMIPLCQRCWIEASETERLSAAATILNQWKWAGVYGNPNAGGAFGEPSTAAGSFDQEAWDDHRLEIYCAVKGGL